MSAHPGIMRTLALLLAAAVLAGCLSPAAEQAAGPTYRVSGSFTRDFDGDDARDLEARLAPWYDRIAIMESYPAQYSLGGLGAEDCVEVRAILAERPYVATVGECRPETAASENPDAPVSSDS